MKGNFQIILIIIFIVFAVLGILVFSGTIPLGKTKVKEGSGGTVVIWGTLKPDLLYTMVQNFNDTYKTYTLKYEQKSPDSFSQDLLEALASGKGPDLFFMPDSLAFDYSNKIFTIPYASYPIATFQTSFASAAEVFLTSQGVLALPIAIDPLVMYYNRSMLNANGVVYPPSNWSEVVELAPKLTKTDESRLIQKSAVALGQYSNINNAKDILIALFLETGNAISKESNGRFSSALMDKDGASNMVNFYTNFSNPLANEYSWNKSLQNSRDAFSAENLALYFGFASELGALVNKNPNQDFLAAPFPQLKNATFKATAGRVTGVAISKFSKNLNSAIQVAGLLTNSSFAESYALTLGAAPARRDLLAKKPTDSFYPTFYDSALFAKSWLDPSPVDTSNIFRRMIDGILSNSINVEAGVRDASNKITNLYLK